MGTYGTAPHILTNFLVSHLLECNVPRLKSSAKEKVNYNINRNINNKRILSRGYSVYFLGDEKMGVYFGCIIVLIILTVIGSGLINTENNATYRFVLRCVLAVGYLLITYIIWSELLLLCQTET